MSPEDEIASLRAQLQRARAQVRRAHEELDWAHEQIRVLRRVIERLGRS